MHRADSTCGSTVSMYRYSVRSVPAGARKESILRRLIVTVVLFWSCAAAAGPLPYASGWASRARFGEYVDPGKLEVLRGELPEYTTRSLRQAAVPRVSLLGRVFGVPPAAIMRFRWGRSLAPDGHRLAGSSWYTIWYTDEIRNRVGRLTLRVDSLHRVIEVAER